MKNLKNIFKILLLLFVVSSCDDDEFVPPNEFVVGAFTSSFGNEAIRETSINEFAAFLDLSAGATYHEWRIPEGAFFLKGPIPSNQRTFERFIINPGDSITTERSALVLFPEANSETKVVIYNEFDEPTQFILPADFVPGTGPGTGVIMDTVRTQLVGDKHVFTYEILIDVYADVMADLAIRDIDGNNIDFRNLSEIDIKFGDKLIFEDLSGTTNNARPTTTNWRIHTIEENRDDEEDIFNIISEEEAVSRIDTITFNRRIGRFRSELTASRPRTENLRGSMNRLRIPLVFNVTSLDSPYTQEGTVEETLNGAIEIPLSATVTDLTNNPASAFTVNVNGSLVEVISVEKSDTNGNVLILTPDGVFADTDMVTVSYDGSADIQSIDERPLAAFTGVPVVNFIIIPAVQTGAIVELMDQTIQVPFDVAFDPATFTGDPTQGFEVLVNGIPFPLQTVTIDPVSMSTLNIILNDPIFRPDVITVSHDGSGDIRIVSGGAIGAFTGVPVEMHDVSLLTDGGFEGEIDGVTWTSSALAGGSVEFTTEQAFSGSKSAKMVNNRPRLESRNELIDLDAGTYTISYQRFVPTTVDLSALPATVGDKFNVGPSNFTIRWDASGPITQGVWEAVEGEITLGAPAAGAFIRIQPVPTTGDLTVFLDDFKIQLKEERP
ncbi:hypothetical protein [uncultured Algibacter sp.]|uniref:hypothetical protein n=1 Tax=uncultured Algibacter sp. TaxID=298659 RepID=UPI003216588F